MESAARASGMIAAATPLLHTAATCTRASHLLLLIPLIVSCMLLLVGRRRSKSRHHEPAGAQHRPPPSPRGLPVVGNLHQLGRLPHRSLRALAASHGPVMLLRLGRVPVVVVSSADAAREVMREQDDVFATRPSSLAVPRRLMYGCTDIAFAPHGAYWRGARKMAVRHLLGPARVRAYRAVREQEADALARRVASYHDGGVAVPLSELLSGFAKDATGRIVLGVRAGGDDGWRAKVDALLDESNALLAAFHVGDCVPWLSWLSAIDGTGARLEKAFRRIDGILDEILDDAATRMGTTAAAAGPDDDACFVHVLLSLQKESEDSEHADQLPALTKDNVKALLEDLFGAGAEATIVVLEWAMAELLRNKDTMRKLQGEVRRGSSPTIITEQDLPRMEYLRAVIKETMRLHTPGPLLLPRESMRATRIRGGQKQLYDVPGNTMVVVNAWAIGRDPETWGESAEEFRPERFVGSEVDFRGRHFQLVPFGAGRRMCPGVNLAMSMVELALANLVGRFDWALPEGEHQEMDMMEAPGFTLRKRAPLRAVATTHRAET